jgi:hypothetical protein
VSRRLKLARATGRPLAGIHCWSATEYLDAPDEERERNHIMTTSHAQESPDDVAFFFAFITSFDGISFDRFLVLHLGDRPDVDAVDCAVQAQARALAG